MVCLNTKNGFKPKIDLSPEFEITKAFPEVTIQRSELVQELWSGYGEISRYWLADGTTMIVKHVKLPEQSQHPRGWDTDISHKRKLKSYQVEINWYTGLCVHSDESWRIPKLLVGKKDGQELLMIMEDLGGAGFPERKSNLTHVEIKSCLSWLAHFHAKNLNVDGKGLWDIGTYWHLATRPDELAAMSNLELKAAAKAIDQKLNGAKYQTLVHGDAKVANFCFSESGREVAAVDFQYIGKGCGMKDVAYLLSSCLDEQDLLTNGDALVEYYFEVLQDALEESEVDSRALIREWKELYAYAWADFYRFLDGWSPGHWKMHGYSEQLTSLVLNDLKDE